MVFFLNSKNEDHDALLTRQADQYEDEIQAILSDARQRLGKYSSALQSTVPKSHHDSVVAKLTQEYDDVRVKATSEHQVQLEKRSGDTVRRFREAYDKRVEELASIRKEFEKQTQQLDQAHQQAHKTVCDSFFGVCVRARAHTQCIRASSRGWG